MTIQPRERLIRILFVGGGHGCYDILKLLTSYSLESIRTEVVGVVDPNPRAKGRLLAEELKISTANSFHHFLNQDRKPDLIIELTGNDSVVEEVYRQKGFRVRVLDHLGALFLWEIIAIQKKHIELEQKVRELDTMAAMGEMAGRLTHELRNPLMIFGGLVRRVMTSPYLDHSVRKRLKRASDQVQRMEEVISDICDVVRPLRPRMESVNMTPFLQQWCREAGAEAGLMGVTIKSQIEEELPSIQVDPSLLRQALFHLLENSFDAMDDSRGMVDVKAELCWDHIYIIISDSGAGFGDIGMGKAIQPFASTREGRLGMGLTLCRQIIFSHNGELEIRALDEGGTMVVIQLPVVFEKGEE